jgi:hypothetical protein
MHNYICAFIFDTGDVYVNPSLNAFENPSDANQTPLKLLMYKKCMPFWSKLHETSIKS